MPPKQAPKAAPKPGPTPVKKTPVKPQTKAPVKKAPVANAKPALPKTGAPAKKPVPKPAPKTQSKPLPKVNPPKQPPQQQGWLSKIGSQAASGIGSFTGAIVTAAGNGVAGAGKGAGARYVRVEERPKCRCSPTFQHGKHIPHLGRRHPRVRQLHQRCDRRGRPARELCEEPSRPVQHPSRRKGHNELAPWLLGRLVERLGKQPIRSVGVSHTKVTRYEQGGIRLSCYFTLSE